MTKIFNHPTVRKVVNKKTIMWFTIFKLLTYIVLGGVFFANKLNANAASAPNQVKIANEQRVYYIDFKAQRKKAYNSEKAFFSYGRDFSDIVAITPDQLNQWPSAKLIKQKGNQTIYYIADGKKCAISGPETLKKMELGKEPILTVNSTDLNSYRNADCSEVYAPTGGSTAFTEYYNDKFTNERASDYNYTSAKMFGQTNGSYAPATKDNVLGTLIISNEGSEDILLKSLSIVTTDQDMKYAHGFYNLGVGLADTNKKLGYTIVPQGNQNLISLGRYELPSHQSVVLNITVSTLSYAPIGTINNTLAKLEFETKQGRVNATINATKNISLSATGQLSAATGGSTNSTNIIELIPKVQTSTDATTSQTATAKTSGTYAWPTSSHTINYYFEDPTYPFHEQFEHNGLDIEAYQGSSVYAAQSGTVVQVVDNHDTSFNYLRIRHEDGTETGYGHLSRIDVTLGQLVAKGEKIGLSGGQPGTIGAGPYTTGSHLHFEVIKNNVYIDPLPFLK